MVTEASVETFDSWENTRKSVANFRRLLLCSKCSDLLKEPVCLRQCQHVICRSCVSPEAGDSCPVCHKRGLVKERDVNRQLGSVVEVFCGLESLFNPVQQPDSSVNEIPPQPETPVLKHKKNFRICFSPRSRKVRCIIEKASDVPAPGSASTGGTAAAQQESTLAPQQHDLSIFNFTTSSQDSGSASPPKCNRKIAKKRSIKKNASSRKLPMQRATRVTRQQTIQDNKKKSLEAINRQWGITEGEVPASSEEEQQPRIVGAKGSSKRVSFQSPSVSSEGPRLTAPDISERESPSADNSTVLTKQTHASPSISNSNKQDKLDTDDFKENPPNLGRVSPPDLSKKRVRKQPDSSTLQVTPKRPRALTSLRQKSLDEMSPAVMNTPSLSSPRGRSPSVLAVVASESHRKSPRSPNERLSPGSPAVMKRNHKGETPLHLAAIKGDVEAVRELLEQGADPNLKDNAGWTPLHEACNLGHLAVVEALVSKGTLLNTPGYENDSPLHDAVRNSHPAIVRLLLQLGASQNVLNLYGKRPADYAASVEMLEIFQEVSDRAQYANAPPSHSPSASLSLVTDCVRKDRTVMCLASKLSAPEQRQLARLGQQLGGKIAETFSSSVSHVVVPEGQMPTTFSTLLGLLAGCWVVRYSWVEACLRAGGWVSEAEHEAGEGPQRSRLNRCSLLPQLFDGCFFFLHGSFKAPNKEELRKLLQEGGGQLLSRQPKPDSDVTQTLSAAAYHALPGSDQALCTQYILYDPRGSYRPAVVRRGKVWSAPSSWLIDCITAFSLLPVPEPQKSK